MANLLSISLITILLSWPFHAFAQDLEGESDAPAASSADAAPSNNETDIEALYDKEEVKTDNKQRARTVREQPKEVETLSDLATLAPFEDVAVIQPRFLPKTGRFELSGGTFLNLNNPFFNSVGVDVRAAYYLTEKYAIEGLLTVGTTASRQVTDDLEKDRGITTDNVVTSKAFGGILFKWNPIYGKITWLNRSIVPFDLNFNVGFGMTQTTEEENEPTIHLGTSQVFAWTKSMAFRWDLMWNMYQATTTDDAGKKETLNQNDLFLGIGMSFYFPEASYR